MKNLNIRLTASNHTLALGTYGRNNILRKIWRTGIKFNAITNKNDIAMNKNHLHKLTCNYFKIFFSLCINVC